MWILLVLCWSALLVSMLPESGLVGALEFTQKPKSPSVFPVGSNATLVWDYSFDELNTELIGVIFAVKVGPTFVSMIVKSGSDGSVVPHPDQPTDYKGRVFIEGKASLVIKNLTLNDSTEFRCTVKVEVQSLTSTKVNDIMLIVTVPPKCSVDPSVRTVNVGGNARFTCNATGVPVPNITWTRQNKLGEVIVIEDSVKYQLTSNKGSSSASSELTMQNISVGDYGYYNCNATGYGFDKTTGFLGVPFFNVVGEPESTISTPVGQPYLLECPVRGFPPPEVTWKVPNGTVLASRLSATLAIVADLGNYTCSAKSLDNEVSKHVFTIENDVKVLDFTVESGAPVFVKWSEVPSATYYLLKITGDDIKDDSLFGRANGTQIHLNALNFNDNKKKERVKIDVQVLAKDDGYRLIARGDHRTATVSGAATFHACIVPLFVALMHTVAF